MRKRIFNNNAHVQPKIWFLLLHNICVNVIFFRRNRDMYVLFLHKRKFHKKNTLESSKIDFYFKSSMVLTNRNQTKIKTMQKFSSRLLHFCTSESLTIRFFRVREENSDLQKCNSLLENFHMVLTKEKEWVIWLCFWTNTCRM